MKVKHLHLDFETFSELDLKKVGAYRYAMDDSTEVLFASFAMGKGKVHRWDTAKSQQPPKQLLKWLNDPNVLIYGYNVQFERLILKFVMGIDLPIERFRCTMIHAFGLSFAGTLDQVGEQVDLPMNLRKDKAGKDLIRRFCQPTPKNHNVRRWTAENAPEEWEEFGEYCDQDVRAERAIEDFLERWPLRQEEWDGWFLDQRINDRGIPIDMALVDKALAVAEKERDILTGKMHKITRLENPNSRSQLLEWLESMDYPLANLQHATLVEVLANPIALPKARKKKVRAVLEMKTQLAKASVSKYEALKRAVCPDGRLYGSLQYMGAQRTSRWAGRLFQPQNLPRPDKKYEDTAVELVMADEHPKNAMTVLATAVRGAICAGHNRQLTVSDLAGIEGRVLPWLCFDYDKLGQIEGGLDMYIVAAASIYHVHYDLITKDQRFVGKVAELALGYQGALGALNSMAKAYGLDEFEEGEGYGIVRAWRKANKPIVDFWRDCERAARSAINNPDTAFEAGRIIFFYEDDFLFCELPSGRCLSYYQPEIQHGDITYMGMNSFTRKWERLQIYGGKFAENFAQAVSRDILIDSMFKIETYGFPIVGTVHDEIMSEPKQFKKYDHTVLSKMMSTQPEWALDLPLAAEGYTGKRFKK